ncbi:DNA polymerase kappa [Fagus crenata]
MEKSKESTSSASASASASGDTHTPRPWQSYHTVYTNAKAGMDGVDKEKVQRIVYEMSKGSKYFENEERKEAFMRHKIDNMRAQCAKLTPLDISQFQKVAEKRILELEATRDFSRTWLHVDMDAFYAAVETLSNPSLKGKPMAVGGMSMISTANYEARRFGVRAAMPGFIARKLCPELIFVPVDFKKYTYCSDLTRKVFQKYDPNFMAASLDEAYLDITDVCKERGMTSGEIAEELRTSVFEETGLTCSAGVGSNRLLAKVCSDINKPNGQFVLPNDRMAVMTFISSLPIRKIGGIGKVTEHILRDAFGINTCEDMLQKGGLLCALFSRSSADFFLSVGLGLGQTETPQVRSRKSISNERTFSATEDEASLYQKLSDLAEMLSVDMQKEGLFGRTLTLKLKTAAFEVRTRAVTLQKYICSSEDILKYASKLLKAELPVSLRLIGLRLSQFNADKDVAPADPAQKTLTYFLIPGDVSRKSIVDNSSMGSIVNDHHLMNDTETGFSIGSHEACSYDGRDLLDSSHFPDLEDNNRAIGNNDGEMDNFHEPLNNENANKVNTPERKSHHSTVSELKADSSSVKCVFSTLDEVNKRANLPDDDAVSSSNQGELLLWLNDYKCSLCGIELPPSFVEERQEHFDFHLAERLQKEESRCDTRMLRHRFSPKDSIASQRNRKKQKTSPKDKGHIPIDLFFVKSSQNF